MESNEYFNADLSADLVTKINLLKHRRNCFHAIAIETLGTEDVETVFDNTWIYDPCDPFASKPIIASLTGEIVKKYDKFPGTQAILTQMKMIKEAGKNVK